MTELTRYARDPVDFIARFITKNELGQPFTLTDHQRAVLSLAFTFDVNGRLPYDTILWSCPKKSGKTTINAAVVLWWAFTQEPPNEILIVANDEEQAQSRVFAAVVGLLRHNPVLGASAEITSRWVKLTNATRIPVLSSDYASSGGANHGLVSHDELWASTSERSRRLWDELTPVPTRRNSIRFITTYAGYEGESDLLWSLYRLGVGPEEHPEGQGTRIHPTLPLYANTAARLFAYWDHEPRMPWQTPEYYAAQKRSLRPAAYVRLHENRWTTGVSVFILPDLWDPCVDGGLSPALASPEVAVFIGVDAATKSDCAAVVAVAWERRGADQWGLRLVAHRIWTPTPGHPLSLEHTVEAYLHELRGRFRIAEVVYDPYQLARSAATLTGAGLRLRELPQTVPNTTAMGSALFEALKSRRLRMYPDAQLRQMALNTVAVENPRGFRIAKEKAASKIDGIVALSMAALSAIDAGPQRYADLHVLDLSTGLMVSLAEHNRRERAGRYGLVPSEDPVDPRTGGLKPWAR